MAILRFRYWFNVLGGGTLSWMGSKFEHIENSKKRKKCCFKGVLKCTVPCFKTVDYTFFRNYLPYSLTIITISLQHSDSPTWWRVIAYPSKPIKVVPTTVFSFIHRKLLFRLLKLMIPSFFLWTCFHFHVLCFML